MPGRILVVDDERLFREMYREMLEARGYDVRSAASGPEALAALAADRADLLLADVHMAGMDGIDLVGEALRRDPGLEAVAVTAADDLSTAVRAMQAGCADFLVKPVGEEQLARSAARALSRARVRREHGRLLDENLEFARSQSLLQQSLAILGTLDLEVLQDQVLEVLARVTDAQGAALWIADEAGELRLRAYRGLVDRAALPPRIDPRAGERASRLQAGLPFVPPDTAPGEALEVPLLAEGEPLGLALLTDRARGGFGDEERDAASALGRFAAIAIRNARRFQGLERVGLRDRDSGAYNLAYFVDYAGKEFYKARRYGRAFSLAVVTVDGAERLRRQAGREGFRAGMRGLVTAASRAMRDADILAKVTESEYYVLLPETDHFGALMFGRRAAEEVRREPAVQELEGAGPSLALGAATFPRDGEDFEELIHCARLRQEEHRRSLVRRLPVSELGPAAFWELADLLLDAEGLDPRTGASARRPADPELFASAQREAGREIGRDPRARGLLYVGPRDGGGPAAVLEALPQPAGVARAGDRSARIVLLGPHGALGEAAPGHPLVSRVALDGERRFQDHEFLLYLSEQAAYALVQDARGRAFHTADPPLVDALVSRLEALYDLEPM
jgi:CheY-like chemotaxis protein/GGDEF domain-containing protein